MSDGKDGCIVVIGLIASLIAIFVFFTGKANIWEVFGWPSASNPVPIIVQPEPDAPQVSGNLQPASETIQLAESSMGWAGRLLLWYDKDGNVMEVTSNGNTQSLFPVPSSASLMRWSPDGKRIAYVGRNVDGQVRLFVMDSDSSNRREIDGVGVYGGIVWSSDSKRILSADQFKFVIVEIDSGNIDDLGYCGTEKNIGANLQFIRDIAWSDDNKKIAFYDANHRVIVRTVENDECVGWLTDYEYTDDGGPLLFSKDASELIFSNGGMLYRIPEPGTSSVGIVPIGKIAPNYSPPQGMVWSPDKRYIAIRGSYGATVLDMLTGSHEQILDQQVYGKDSLGWLR